MRRYFYSLSEQPASPRSVGWSSVHTGQIPDQDHLEGFGLVDLTPILELWWSPVGPQHLSMVHLGSGGHISVLMPVFSLASLVGNPAALGVEPLTAPGLEGLRPVDWIIQWDQPLFLGEASQVPTDAPRSPRLGGIALLQDDVRTGHGALPRLCAATPTPSPDPQEITGESAATFTVDDHYFLLCLVPEERFELSRPFGQQLLRLPRLPLRHSGIFRN
ncbi:hypothetical protein LCGC14_1916120 [marine sediment metagenome]|uniref:Uncharacterized protein n=1 Tax=marine sediment metagenome TaxID=412755 RepID=A0A0F9FS13_9ZZZZ